jgi:hypothetical protein
MTTETYAYSIDTRAPIYLRNVWRDGDRVRVVVYTDGDVVAWDSVAGHYCRCSRLTPAQLRYARAEAKRLAA